MAPIETPGDASAIDETEFSVPVEDLGFGPEAKELHDRLTSRIIGQERACMRLARAYSVQSAGLGDATLPAGSYVFAGPTGVGKTLVAEELARYIVADVPRAPLTRIACGKMKERHQASTLIGAPPGYLGHDKPALLAQLKIDSPAFWARAEPYLKGRYKSLDKDSALAVTMDLYRKLGPYPSVILMDEFDRGHESLNDYLLHMLDDGELSMDDGSVTRFNNAYIILTCNVGADDQQKILKGKRGKIGYATESESERKDKDALIYEMTMSRIEEKFDPALVGRLRNEIIVFRVLSKESARSVLELMLNSVRKMVNGSVGSRSILLSLNFTDAFKEFLLDEGYSLTHGLRPLRKIVYKFVTSPLANGITNGEIKEADVLLFAIDGEGPDRKPVLRRKPRAEARRVSDEEADRGDRTTIPMGSEGNER